MDILISSCLCGVRCRFDGVIVTHIDLSFLDAHTLHRVCPEVLGGLSVPRHPCEIRNGRVITDDGYDRTREFTQGARAALAAALNNGCTAALLKARSPSCGAGRIYDGSFSGKIIDGDGVLAGMLRAHGIAVFCENELDALRDFIALN